ncbi:MULTISPECIES: hypothetical protein [unclassified Asaia]|uniref:hypothetical protein n=1 Tax=unclassified Asaia TaxID=2685023 RepID=UPI0011D03CDE|nr:hypothetical protein [Asaia sp. W19]
MTAIERNSIPGQPSDSTIVDDNEQDNIRVSVAPEEDGMPACIIVEQDDDFLNLSYEQANILAATLTAFAQELPRV